MTATPEIEMLGAITIPEGFAAGGIAAGVKESGRLDVALLVSEKPAAAAAVFTKNVVKAAPVLVDQEHVRDGRLQAVVVNSGIANCATGEQGMADAREMAQLTSARVGCAPEDVFVMSTGVIGHFLPMERITRGVAEVQVSKDGGGAFARAIMTTDSVPKETSATFQAQGQTYRLGGCAKGAGMIHPDMATMLAFLTTDAPLAAEALRAALLPAVERSFNMVTVDGDTSTNDSVVILSNGAAGGGTIRAEDHEAMVSFAGALEAACTRLAKMVARDGEGSTKLIEMTVTGAADEASARAVARSVVRSPLLKAALSKGDPNWGRVLMAAGYAGVPFDPDTTRMWLGKQQVVGRGTTLGMPEAVLAREVAGEEVSILLDLSQGEATATAWGCDLTEEYVRFNADYTT